MIHILAPCFNEQATIVSFLHQLEAVLKKIDSQFTVVIVNDCSQDNTLLLLKGFSFESPNILLKILHLRFNLGHQGAIYQGLLYIAQTNATSVIIMDSDGEDDPRAIPLLLGQPEFEIVEVKRGRRSESITFKFFYRAYRMLFRLITGKSIDYGNFCLIDRSIVERIKYTSFIHLPAYLLKQKAMRASIVFDRGKRIDGKSKMGFKGLLFHAFKSMIEFAEDLLLLFFKLFIVIIVVLAFLLVNISYQKFIAHTAVPGWFSTVAISLVILALLCMGFFIVGILLLNLMHQQNSKTTNEVFVVIKKSEDGRTP